MDQLTDDILVEILSRVPYRSLLRCSCVSRRWRALVAHPDHRRKLPQTLAGFFYHDDPTICFADASGNGLPLVDTSLAFLPDRELKSLNLLDSCNGLLLCSCFRLPDYLVINPATERWVIVPVTRHDSDQAATAAYLGFDPAFSLHFYVFEFQLDSDGDGDDDHDADGLVLGVKIYSSETGLWSYKQSGWSDEVTLASDCKSVFVNGMLYVVSTEFVIGAVDVEGKTWRIIGFPYSEKPFLDAAPGYIDLSKGQLHLVIGNGDLTGAKLGIWVLEDRNSEEWTLKHTPTYQVVQPINGDPFIGSLETPVTSSPLVAWYLSNLPAYRTAVSPLLRGVEIGLAHGYLLVGPFALTGPLRNTPVHGQAGALGAIGLVTILSVCLTMYGVASFNEGAPSTAPTLTLTGRKKEADKLQTADGWAKFTGGFFFGGVSGAIWAYFLLYVLDLPYYFK